jgi:hypothetical protein
MLCDARSAPAVGVLHNMPTARVQIILEPEIQSCVVRKCISVIYAFFRNTVYKFLEASVPVQSRKLSNVQYVQYVRYVRYVRYVQYVQYVQYLHR